MSTGGTAGESAAPGGAAGADGRGAIRQVGFVGIGNMGWPMAARLVEAGFSVAVADAVPGRAGQFAAEIGGRAARDAAEAADGAEALVTILPTSAHVSEVIEQARAALQPGCVVVEMSSGVPGVTQALAESLAGAGVEMIDCPVSGGVARARTGDLAILVGGDDAPVGRADALLRAMGSSLHRCGGVGSAQAMKALNNLVSAGGFLIGIEALLVGQRFGLDPSVMVDVLNASSGMTNSSQRKFKQFVLSRRFDSGFGLDLMAKDLGIALEVARDTHTPAPFSALCRELWASAAGLLGPGQDHTALARLSEALCGETLGGNKAVDAGRGAGGTDAGGMGAGGTGGGEMGAARAAGGGAAGGTADGGAAGAAGGSDASGGSTGGGDASGAAAGAAGLAPLVERPAARGDVMGR